MSRLADCLSKAVRIPRQMRTGLRVLARRYGSEERAVRELLEATRTEAEALRNALSGLQAAPVPSRRGRVAELEQANRDLRDEKISRDQYDTAVNRLKPFAPHETLPTPPSDEEIASALSSDKKPFVGAARNLPAGTPVGLRLDIPAFQRAGKYVVTVHRAATPSSVGKRIGYEGFGIVRNPRFFVTNQEDSRDIATGEIAKLPLATVEGAWQPATQIPEEAIGWTQAGYDPERHGFFFDRSSGRPVVGGSEALAVGNSVFVKDAKFGKREDFLYSAPVKEARENLPAVNLGQFNRNRQNLNQPLPSVGELVRENMGLAVSIANQYRNIPGGDFDNTLGEARRALVKAARGYDGSAPFAAYAGPAIRNTLNNLYSKHKRLAAREVMSADEERPNETGESGATLKEQMVDQSAQPAVTAELDRSETAKALAYAMNRLPERVHRVLTLTSEGMPLRAIGKELGISHELVRRILENGKKAVAARLKARGFEGIDPDGALYAASVAATDAQIREEADAIEKAESGKQKAEIPSEPLKEMVIRHTAGRLDALDSVVPGAKDLLTDSHIRNGKISAALRIFRERIQENVRQSFGYPSWWRSPENNGRLKRFTAELLPTAARLNATGREPDGRFKFESFWMRAGELAYTGPGQKWQSANGVSITLRPGVFIEGRGGEKLRVKELVKTTLRGRAAQFWQLERFIPQADQIRLHAAFHNRYPEAAHWLDSWIDPNLRDSRVEIGGVELPDFNRFSLHDFWGEISPFGAVGQVRGYTPDVWMTKSLSGMIAQRTRDLLNRTWTGAGREYKTGEARERGQVRDLFAGFNIRAAEAHMETERRRLAEELLAKSLRPIPESGLPGNWVKWDVEAVDRLLQAYHAAQGLDPAQYLRLKERVLAQARAMGPRGRMGSIGPSTPIDSQQAEFKSVLGALHEDYPTVTADQLLGFLERSPDQVPAVPNPNVQPSLPGADDWHARAEELWQKVSDSRFSPEDVARIERLAGKVAAEAAEHRDKMIHKNALAELRRPLASTFINNGLLRVLDAGIRGATSGLLANPFTLTTNQLSNEIMITMHTARRGLAGLFALASGHGSEGKLGLYEAANLLKGTITDRWYNKRVREIVPDELFEGNHRLNTIATDDFHKSPAELLRELNISSAVLKAMRYGNVDTRAKQRVAFASLLAQARIAWDEHGKAEATKSGIKKADWLQTWMKDAPKEAQRAAYYSAVLVAMDYANVPPVLDEANQVTVGGRDVTAEINLLRRGLVPFGKFPYNLARQGKRYTVDSIADLFGKERSGEQRRQAAANLTMMTLMFLLARALMDDDDKNVPKLGREVDDLGKRLDGAYNTSGRINITRTWLGKTITGALDMFGMHDLAEQEQWMRIRALPYAASAASLMATERWLRGRGREGVALELQENVHSLFADSVSEGLALKMINAIRGEQGPYDKDKNLSFILAENGFDVITGRFVPPPLLRTVNALADTTPHRTRPVPSLGYDPGALEALRLKIPGAAKSLPTSGAVRQGAEGSEKSDAAIAETLARHLPPGNFRRYTDAKGRERVAYVTPGKVQIRPRVLEAFRALGLNVKFVDREEYARELAGTGAE